MIRNLKVKLEIVRDWGVVRKLCEGSHAQYQIPGGPFINESRPDDSYNLPFVLGFAVLDQVLSALRDQGAFSCKGWELGRKMAAAKNALHWQDYGLVHAAKKARDDLAHKARLLSKGECLRYINAIEVELKGWGVI